MRTLKAGDTFRHCYLDEFYTILSLEGEEHIIVETIKESTGEILFAAMKETEDQFLRFLEGGIIELVEKKDSYASGGLDLLKALW